jgi:hypothetical protein
MITMNMIHSSYKHLHTRAMHNKKHITFGDFVAGGYHAWGKREARGIIQLALKTHLVEFLGQQLFVIS